jgi:hypothetical protein
MSGCSLEDVVRRASLLSGVAGIVLLISLNARAKPAADDGYQTATVVSVKKHVSASNYAGDNPSDAPLQARDYAYDIGIRLKCNLYVGRYESAIKYLPSAFAPNHEVDVRLHKHIMYVSLPFSDEEVVMGIIAHKRVKDEVCADAKPKAVSSQVLSRQFAQSNPKGGRV